jgi:hypothetical protein
VSILVGSTASISWQVVDADGALIDSSAQTVTVTFPDGSTTNPPAQHPSLGTYVASFIPTAPGLYPWTATTESPFTVTSGVVYAEPVEPVSMVSLAEIKKFLNITGGADDAEVAEFAAVASKMCEDRTGRAWIVADRTEEFVGGSSSLFLSAPVASVTEVVEDGATLASGDYRVRAYGILAREGCAWGSDVTVTYTAGVTTIPTPVRDGVKLLTRHLWETQRGGSRLPRRGVDEDTYNPGATYSLPRRVLELWAPYTAPGIA